MTVEIDLLLLTSPERYLKRKRETKKNEDMTELLARERKTRSGKSCQPLVE